MANSNIAEILGTTTQTAESALFANLFGINAESKWFQYLMRYAGHYIFTTALILSVIKLVINIYQFYKTPNKNLTKTGSLIWNIATTGLIATAIIGALVAGTVFALITPVLFVTTMAADTLRNFGLFLWNTFKLASLWFRLRNHLKDGEDSFIKRKYEKLKAQYITNIKQHLFGFLIGAVLTTAIAVIFLFGHIPATATISGTVISVGAFKFTVASAVGASSGAIVISSIALPPFFSWLKKKITDLAHTAKQSTVEVKEEKQEENPRNSEENNAYALDTDEKLKQAKAITEGRDEFALFKGYTYGNKDRDLVIEGIKDKETACATLLEFINNKIKTLQIQIDNNPTSFQRNKREQKLDALQVLKGFLENKQILDDRGSKINTIPGVLEYIIRRYPKVNDSFFLEMSDTKDILKAALVYAKKFYPNHFTMPAAEEITQEHMRYFGNMPG